MNSQSLLNVPDSHAFLPESRREESRGFAPNRAAHRGTMLLGLPRARCRAYYAAALSLCPFCGCAERVSASVFPLYLSRSQQ